MPFVHLHNHSHYSLLDGAQNIDQMISRAKLLGMTSIGLTDHGNLHGSLKFYKECRKQGIKPIIGYEAYVTNSVGERARGVGTTHLTILAKTTEGWRNLVKLSSFASTEGFYVRPRIDREVLFNHRYGLIILSGCIGGELSRQLLNDDLDAARQTAEWYYQAFGDDFYLEIQENGTEVQRRAKKAIIELSGCLSIPLVATADCHYTNPDDADLQDVMVCITTGKLRQQEKEAPRLEETCYYMRDEAEMLEAFSEVRHAVHRSGEIAEKCNVEIETGVRHFPKFKTDEQVENGFKQWTPEAYLRQWCYGGLHEKLGKTNSTYTGRLERELKVIHDLGFNEYFLVVADFCEWARNHGIYSTARGSGVGSLVCFTLGISHVDPIEYGLLFERFLDPSRREAPDIDVDFDKERRAEVMEYVKGKYGADCACQIGTFGTFGAKMSLKDVGKVEFVPQAKIQKMAVLIPELPGTTLASARSQIEELNKIIEDDVQCERLFNMAQRIEGMAKSVGTHAAGVVISDKPLINYVPVMRGKDGSTVTQWDMGDCEEVGLLKMDFLGLRNLTILSRCIKIIEDRTGKRINVKKIPMDDPEVYASLARGETAGVFQLEPPGMTGLLVRMKPTCLENIIACIALYRPGPLDAGMVDEYVAVKNGERSATYAHPVMEKILGYTYGVMVYQEQVMMVLNQVGNIPLSESYSCIKAISKKIKEKVEKYRPLFVKGCAQNGVDGEALWEQIGTFARYGFNKSHSTAYAFIAYQTAWLKHYYPVEFMAALLSCDVAQRSFTGRDMLCGHIEDSRRQGIEVVPPHVNTSGPDFRVRNGRIYFGLDAIKGVPHAASVAVAAAQPFTDLFDFCARVPKAVCPRAAIRNLIYVGAMPGEQSRESMEATIDRAMKLGEGSYKNPEKQTGKWNPGQPRSKNSWLALERELTGMFIHGHPMDEWPWMRFLGDVRSCDGAALVGGVITTIEERLTHAGKKFYTFVLDSGDFTTECIMWEPNAYMLRLVKDGVVVVVRGTVNHRGPNGALTVNSIRMPDDYLREHKLGVVVDADPARAGSLLEIAARHPGNDAFAIRVDDFVFVSHHKITLTRALLDELSAGGCKVNLLETRSGQSKSAAR